MLIEPPIRYFGKENVTSCLTLPSIVNNVPMPYHFIHTLVARLNIQIKNQISPRISIKDFFAFPSCVLRENKDVFTKQNSNVL